MQAGSTTEVSTAFRRAAALMRRTRPARLVYDPAGPAPVNEALRIVVMALAAQTKYDHLYVEKGDLRAQLDASYRAYDLHQEYARVLAAYPDPVAARGFRMVKVVGSLSVIDATSGTVFNTSVDEIPDVGDREAVNLALAKRDAVIDFMYAWCIEVAGNRFRNFRLMYRSEGATLSADEIRDWMRPQIKKLIRLSQLSELETYYVIKRLLLEPLLPFGIRVPS